MKRAKRIYILLGVLAVVCAAAFAVLQYQEQQEIIENTDEIILEVDSSTVQSLSWTYESETLSFHRDGAWRYDEDEAFPVDGEKMDELLETFQAFGAAFIIHDVTDFAQYGLDDPVCTINLSTEDASYEIQLGDYSTMDAQRYVSIGDGNVYLVQEDPLDAFNVELSDLIDNDETPDFGQVASIQFTGADSYQVVYQEDSSYARCADDVYFREQDGTYLPLDTSLVNSYLSGITGLNLTDYVTYSAGEEDLAAYGLDDPELTVSVTYTPEADEDSGESGESVVFTLSISRDPAERNAAEDGDSGEEDAADITAYARVGQSEIIYQITGAQYQSLMAASYNDLRHQEVFSADFADVTGLDITLEGTVYTITSEGSGESKTFSYDGEEIEIGGLQDALEALTASSFTDESPAEKEEISLTVQLDNENCPEIQIQLYRYDGEQCLAVVDGAPVSLVSRASVVDLIEAVNAIVL
ncbi:DUF4340 domain-containing protein [Pseudoflavonifractor capillosus]|uniref:DUF4340 domain-containing protein n=1 Tax=Pseudoflavonifractor capillosus TaxID=106588 RepID=A0A921SS90_9FIRM|nr:DUF4340 domain-containing protein [Pseudoflavonifractor capillosus]HJG86645.1 DUF4340 domain-containing protein [Pseudoflavonifractor capillosus]